MTVSKGEIDTIVHIEIISKIPEIFMPRLVGKSSKTPLYIGVVLLLALAGATALEYLGVIDLVPGFGRDHKPTGRAGLSSSKVSDYSDSLK
jgi:hypothetical protein